MEMEIVHWFEISLDQMSTKVSFTLHADSPKKYTVDQSD